MSLTEDTKTMLDDCMAAGYSLRRIAMESNGTVEYEWLRKAMQAPDRLGSATTNRVQALHDCLVVLLAGPAKIAKRDPQRISSAG